MSAELKRIYKSVLDEVDFHTKTDIMYQSRIEYESNWDGSDDFEVMTDFYPKPMPDGHLQGWPNDYENVTFVGFLVEVWHQTVPFWVYRKRIQYLIEYTDDETWQEYFTGSSTPPFLLVCENSTLQRRVQRYLRRIYDSLSHDYQFLVTNQQLLAEAKGNGAIWTRVDNETTETIWLTDVPESYT